jgi:hypothetical protein
VDCIAIRAGCEQSVKKTTVKERSKGFWLFFLVLFPHLCKAFLSTHQSLEGCKSFKSWNSAACPVFFYFENIWISKAMAKK